jgi:hypothetical protein
MDEAEYFHCSGAKGQCSHRIRRAMILGAATAQPDDVRGYKVQLAEGTWWAYRTLGADADRVYCPSHHQDAENAEREPPQ